MRNQRSTRLAANRQNTLTTIMMRRRPSANPINGASKMNSIVRRTFPICMTPVVVPA